MSTLNKIFNDIATALQEKTGDSNTMLATEFETKIDTIETENKTVIKIGENQGCILDLNVLKTLLPADILNKKISDICYYGSGYLLPILTIAKVSYYGGLHHQGNNLIGLQFGNNNHEVASNNWQAYTTQGYLPGDRSVAPSDPRIFYNLNGVHIASDISLSSEQATVEDLLDGLVEATGSAKIPFCYTNNFDNPDGFYYYTIEPYPLIFKPRGNESQYQEKDGITELYSLISNADLAKLFTIISKNE